MTRIHTIRLLRVACAIEFLLRDFPCGKAILTGMVAEKWDYACRADDEVGSGAKCERQR